MRCTAGTTLLMAGTRRARAAQNLGGGSAGGPQWAAAGRGQPLRMLRGPTPGKSIARLQGAHTHPTCGLWAAAGVASRVRCAGG